MRCEISDINKKSNIVHPYCKATLHIYIIFPLTYNILRGFPCSNKIFRQLSGSAFPFTVLSLFKLITVINLVPS